MKGEKDITCVFMFSVLILSSVSIVGLYRPSLSSVSIVHLYYPSLSSVSIVRLYRPSYPSLLSVSIEINITTKLNQGFFPARLRLEAGGATLAPFSMKEKER